MRRGVVAAVGVERARVGAGVRAVVAAGRCGAGREAGRGGGRGVARSAGRLAPDAAAEPDPGSPLGVVWAGVKDARVSPGLALSALGEVARLEPRLEPDAVPTVTRGVAGAGHGVGCGSDAQAAPGDGRDVRRGGGARRPAGAVGVGGAVVAAVGGVRGCHRVPAGDDAGAGGGAGGGDRADAAPAPNEETGERDLRPAGQRRVEALAEVCRRSSGLDADGRGREVRPGARRRCT